MMKSSKYGMKKINKTRKNDDYAANYIRNMLKARMSKLYYDLPSNLLSTNSYEINQKIKKHNESLKQFIDEL